MESLIATAQAILEWLQMPAIIGAAIAFCIGGYYLMFGGDQGRQKAIKWFVGGSVGLVVILGAFTLANSVSTNISF
jgi:Type IV secretion system pilin